jgi:diguanylate cyclase (GGDEF)-like protein
MQKMDIDNHIYIEKFNQQMRNEARYVSCCSLLILSLFSTWDIFHLGVKHPAIYSILFTRFSITLPVLLLLFLKSYQGSPTPRLDLWTSAGFLSIIAGLLYIHVIYHNAGISLPIDSIFLCLIIVYFLTSIFYYQKLILGLTLMVGYFVFLSYTQQSQYEFIRAGVYLFGLNLAGVIHSISFDKSRRTNFDKTQFLRKMAQTDQLTGASNRHKFDEHFTELLKQAKLENQGIAVAIADIDFFKRYNDQYGHFAGDECLIKVAQAFLALKSHPQDNCIRVGGAEFSLIKYGVSLEQSALWGQTIIDTIYKLNLPHETSSVDNRITVSAGLIHWDPTSPLTRNQLMRLADEALYKAKENGRNQVQITLSR